jgi:hypothetical protein
MVEASGHIIEISSGLGRTGGRARTPALGVDANDVAEKESDQTENSWTGKTVLTLTAMYADPAKIGYYPGGVLWLTLGPNKVTLDDFGSDLYWLFLKIGN